MIITYFTFDEVIHDGVTWPQALNTLNTITTKSPEDPEIGGTVTYILLERMLYSANEFLLNKNESRADPFQKKSKKSLLAPEDSLTSTKAAV